MHERAQELARLDQDFAVAAVMGAVTVENGSINGRIPNNMAASAEQQQLRKKRRKKDQEYARAIRQLRDVLQQLDQRIADLNTEIKDLIKQRQDALQKAEEAFGRMHKLEELLEAAKKEGMSEAERDAIEQALGPEAKAITDDAELLSLAQDTIEQEHRDGLAAEEEADRLRQDIEAKKEHMDELIQAREDISNNPNFSMEEKLTRTQEVLDKSLAKDLFSFEKAEANNTTDVILDAHRSDLDDAESFDLAGTPAASPPSFG